MKCILIGGGGHGRVLLETLEQQRPGVVVGVLDSRPGLRQVMEVPVLGGDDLLPKLKERYFTHFVIGVGSSQPCRVRADLYLAARKAGLEPLEVIHPAAVVSHQAQMAAGCQIMARAVVNTGARLGGHVLVNTGAIVEHDVVIGAHSLIGSGVVLGGGVQVGERSSIAAGAVVKQGVRLGARVVISEGVVVKQDVPDGTEIA
jgi:UDP-perosamine 4-acetyltransferase